MFNVTALCDSDLVNSILFVQNNITIPIVSMDLTACTILQPLTFDPESVIPGSAGPDVTATPDRMPLNVWERGLKRHVAILGSSCVKANTEEH